MRRMLTVAAVLAALASPALAKDPEISVETSPAIAPALGAVIRGSSASVFVVSPQGVVTRQSGDALRISNAAVATPTVTLRCEPKCNGRPVQVVIAPAGGTAAARVVRLRAGPLDGGHYVNGPPAEGPVLSFELRMTGATGAASFPLGMDIRLAAGADGGAQTFSYTVTVSAP